MSPGSRSAASVLLVPLLVTVLFVLFAWPASRLDPRDLPVGVAGPPAAAAPLEQTLAARDGAFAVHRYADEAAARAAIENRDVYGALVATPAGPRMLTATAASTSVAQVLHGMADKSGAPVEDVVPLPKAGSGLSSSVFPTIFAGSLIAALVGMLFAGAARQTTAVVVSSVLSGAAATVIVHDWLGSVEGHWLADGGALTLTILAMALFIAGMHKLWGNVGGAVGGLAMVLIGNPFSGVSTAPEMLPQPVGLIGQLLPPGAGGNLLRSTGYFDGAAAGGHIAVLAGWALAGLALMAVAALRERRTALMPVPVPVPA